MSHTSVVFCHAWETVIDLDFFAFSDEHHYRDGSRLSQLVLEQGQSWDLHPMP
jgi:hypothetical protein